MKLVRKSFVLLLVVFAALVAVGCNANVNVGPNGDINISTDLTAEQVFNKVVEAINKNDVTGDLTLTTSYQGATITWASDNADVVSATGKVVRGETDTQVKLTATVTINGQSQTFDLTVTVKGTGEVVSIDGIFDQLVAGLGNIDEITEKLNLVAKLGDATITWTSDKPTVIDANGNVYPQAGDMKVKLTATIKFGEEEKSFNVIVTVKGTGEVLTAEEIFNQIVASFASKDAIEENINLLSSYNGATILWTSETPSIIDYQGKVNRPINDTEVKLTALVRIGTENQVFNITVTIKGTGVNEDEYDKISDAINGTKEAGSTYKVFATVVGVNAQSFLLKDETGIILVYMGTGYAKDLEVGDKVLVEGATTTYGGAMQFDKTAKYSKAEHTEYTYEEAVKPTAEELAAYKGATSVTPIFVEVTGKLSVSGNYFNIVFEETTDVKGSVTYPADADALKLLDGKKVVFKGYVTGVSGTIYVNLMVTEYELAEGEDPNPPVIIDPSELTVKPIAEIVAGEDGQYKAQGTVVATNARGFVLKDETGYIFVFYGGTYAKDLVVGDKVTVTGKTSMYGGAKQFGSEVAYTKDGTDSAFAQPTARVLDATAFDALSSDNVVVEYVKVTAKLVQSGNYINLEVSGASKNKGSIPYAADDLSSFADKTVDVTGYYIYISGTVYVNIIYTEIKLSEGGEIVTPPVIDDLETKTIAEIKAAEDGAYKAEGTVAAINARGFLLKDETGYILAFVGANYAKDLAVGDKVTVTGNTSIYGGAKQFGSNVAYAKSGTDSAFAQPTAKVLTGADFDALATADVEIQYVTVSAELVVSGNYVNLNVNGASVTGSIAYAANDLSEYSGTTVTVTGYFIYVSGSTTKYVNIILTNIDGAEPQPPVEAVVATTAEVLAGTVGNEYKTTGTVAAVNAQSFVLADEAGLINVYIGKNYLQDLAVGDNVTVTGTCGTYGNTKQYTSPTYVKNSSGTYTYPEAKVLTLADYEAYVTLENAKPELVKFYGKLVVSGNYFNLNTNTTTTVGSVLYPVDTDTLKAFDGKNVELVGYYVYTTGTSKYVSFIMVSIAESSEGVMEGDVVKPLEPSTIAEIKEAGEGTFKAVGVVVATNAQSFLIQDETGYILVYRGRDYAKDLAVGDEVSVEGALATYSGKAQFGADSVYAKLGTKEVTVPTAKALTLEEFDAMADAEIQYVSVVGTLVISGNYVNLIVDGATLQGSIVYPAEDYSEFDGTTVTVTGYFVYVSSGKYVSIIATDVAGKELTDEEYIDRAKAELRKLAGTSTKKDIELPTELSKCTIAWASSNPDVISAEGKYTSPAADTDVTLTATITKGEASEVVEIVVKALFYDPSQITEVKFDFVTNFATYASSWKNTYAEHTVTATELGADFDATFTFTNASKQTSTITDRPVQAAGKTKLSTYIVIDADFAEINNVKFVLTQWTTKTFTDIHIEYTLDGTTWTACSSAITTPGEVETTTAVTGAKQVRLVITTTNSGSNVQVGLESIILSK